MGSRFAIMLHQAGNEVILVDGWPEHVKAINEHGLKANFNGKDIVVDLPAFLKEEVDPALSTDLIILFTKAMQLEGMLQAVKPLIHDETKVLCLLNGIGHEEVIEKYVPREKIFIGNTMWTSGLVGPGEVKLFGNGSIDLKNLAPGQEEAAREITRLLSDALLNARYSDNVLYAIYKKACVNGSMNGLCTILDSNMAEFGETGPARDVVRELVGEFVEVAKAEHVDMDLDEMIEHVEECYDRETIGLHYPSMYQDLIGHHRMTEIDYINGAIVRKGKKYGIPTPFCTFLTQLVHCEEQILHAK